jgi:hypothetical protein
MDLGSPEKRSLPGVSCRGGGIGRHAILRGWWAKARGSSNLPLGTIIKFHGKVGDDIGVSVHVRLPEGVESAGSFAWIIVSCDNQKKTVESVQSGSSSAVECFLAKEEVAGSNPVFRSSDFVRAAV